MAEQRRKSRFVTGDDELDAGISELAAIVGGADRRIGELGRQMITTVAKMMLERASVGDLKLVNSALKELRWAFRVFGPTREARKVSVFGSARTQPGEAAYEQARTFGALMAARGWGVVTGAGDGIMGAAHGGAGPEKSWGVNIQLPFEQEANEVVRGGSQLVNFKYFFTRKLVFVKETDAVVLFPGGFGTHDEGFETLTLIQTGKTDPIPVVFVEPPGSRYWQEWHEYVERHLKDPGLISVDDTALYRVTDSVDDAVEEIERFYSVYHSQRYVGDDLVLRLQSELSPRRVEDLNIRFASIVSSGRIRQRPMLDGEGGHLPDLPRLVLDFDRSHAAGLRRLIDAVNATPMSDLRSIRPTGRDPGDSRAERGRNPDARDELADDVDPS